MQIKFTNKPTYAEEGQPNPLRWCILSGIPETGFTNESSWLRCKDFFNDYVVAYNGGKRFNIYGFSTVDMNVAPKGAPVYIALDVLTKSFDNNLAIFQEWLVKNKLPGFGEYVSDCDKLVLEFPEYYFRNTYNISLVSLILRLLNVEYPFAHFDEVIGYKDFPKKDQQKWDVVVAANRFFKLPEQMQEYIWYASAEHNSSKTPDDFYSLSSLVHNCGLLTWESAMKGMA